MTGNLSIVTRPEDDIVHQEPNTDAYVKDECLGTGTLYLSEERLIWCRSDDKGIQLTYPSIVIHAVSRDTTTFPHECLFLMVDQDLSTLEPETMDDNSDSDRDSLPPATEVRLVPACKSNLDAMYQAMCTCQQLHPDEEDQDSENEFYDSIEASGDGEVDGTVLSAQGMANLARMEEMLAASNGDTHDAMDQDDGQFEDVE